MERSILLTGAPATGKTTVYRELLKRDFDPSPPHMTRDKREGEVGGVDGIFVSRPFFQENLRGGFYFEKTEDQALYSANNEYYGCPEYWLTQINSGQEQLAIVPTSLFAANCLAQKLIKDGKTPIDWVHLHASERVRAERLKNRGGVSQHELDARLRKGDTHDIPSIESVSIIDTEGLNSKEVVRAVLRVIKERGL